MNYHSGTRKQMQEWSFSKKLGKKLLHRLIVRELNQIVDIARPIASEMKLLKPSRKKENNQYVPFKYSFALTVLVFEVSTILHLFSSLFTENLIYQNVYFQM